jgi:TRAP-type mannitol/chloroaromatic compound transport system substrate-binding protein
VDLQRILDYAAASMHTFEYMEYERRNAEGLVKIKTDFKSKVELIRLGEPVMKELRKLAVDVNREESEKTPMAKKVYASYTAFQKQHADWADISLGSYHRLVSGAS